MMIKPIVKNVEKGRQIVPHNAIKTYRKRVLEVRLVPADRNKDWDPQEGGFMSKACDRVVADQKITACQFLIKSWLGGGTRACKQIASGASETNAELVGSPREMTFAGVETGSKMAGRPASRLKACGLNPGFRMPST